MQRFPFGGKCCNERSYKITFATFGKIVDALLYSEGSVHEPRISTIVTDLGLSGSFQESSSGITHYLGHYMYVIWDCGDNGGIFKLRELYSLPPTWYIH